MTEPYATLSAKTVATGIGLLSGCISFVLCAVQGDAPGSCATKSVVCGVVSGLAVSMFMRVWEKTVGSLPDDD